MKKLVAIFLLLAPICAFVYAESDDIAWFRVNDRLLTDMSIEELYDLEDAVVSAMTVVFNDDSEFSASGEQIGIYVVNPKTKKFHYPWCYSALQIGPDRKIFRCAPSELVDQKYKPCGQCKPHVNE